MNSIFDFFRSIFGLDSCEKKSAQYFHDCQKAFMESQREQIEREKQKTTNK